MANVLIEESSLEDIADEIRAKNGSSATYRAADMAGAIRSLGGNVNDVQINGTSIVSSGVANIPLASATTVGLVDADTQHFGGQKYFDYGNIALDSVARSPAVNYRQISFKDGNIQSSGNTVQNAVIISQTSAVGVTTDNKMGFRLKSPTTDGTAYTSYYDTYSLPTATAGLTANADYNIITTKPTYEFTGTWSSSYTNCPCFSAMTVGSQVEIEWKQYGKLVCANFKVMRGADTSAGSNCYGANIRNDYLPAVTVCSAGYYSSSAIIAKYDTNGTFTCRVIGATLALNNVVQIGMTFMLA